MRHQPRYDTIEGIRQALSELDATPRLVLWHRHVEGETIERTAELIEKSVETTRRIEQRAIRQVRRRHPELAELLQ